MGGDGRMQLQQGQMDRFNSLFDGAYGAGNKLAGQANDAAGAMQTNFKQYTPTLNANFQQFDPKLQTSFGSNGLDRFSQGLMSSAKQDAGNRLATGNRDIAQRFGNSPVSAILQSQAGMSSQLNNNSLPFMAGLAQRQREGAEMGAVNQARLAQSQASSSLQGQGNQTMIAQQQASSQGQQMQNDALAQKLGIQALPNQIQGNLVSMYNEFLKTMGNSEVQGGGPSKLKMAAASNPMTAPFSLFM